MVAESPFSAHNERCIFDGITANGLFGTGPDHPKQFDIMRTTQSLNIGVNNRQRRPNSLLMQVTALHKGLGC